MRERESLLPGTRTNLLAADASNRFRNELERPCISVVRNEILCDLAGRREIARVASK